jgi:pimeloyl-ACP methyl ester carboxylesterase
MSGSSELTLPGEAGPVAASATVPEAGLIGGLVPLHPSDSPSRHHFLIEHLAATLPRRGIAVLSFDRRRAPVGQDVPLAAQARDAKLAARVLRDVTGRPDLPVGFWGFSQGAWAATVAASEPDTAFLVVVLGSGVSPAEQMRYGTSEQLRRAGYGPDAIRMLTALRKTFERYLRDEITRRKAEELLRSALEEPWFDLAWIPRELPTPGTWVDMDFDPEAAIRKVRCPVLAFFRDNDKWIPVGRSVQRWRAASRRSNRRLEIVQLPGTGHHPTLAERHSIAALSPRYVRTLPHWLKHVLVR